MTKVYTFNTALHHFLRGLVAPWFRKRYDFRLTNPEILEELKPPYILLPNHLMKWDMVLIGILIRDPIHYMASESHFRKKWSSFFLKKLGAFPKAKAKSDLGAIKHMMSLKEQSKIICIYPEGQMSWDGQNLPLFYSTAKLIKMMKIPAYVVVTHGAFAAQPRWAKARRKGPVEYTIKTLSADGRSLKQMSPDEIFNKMETLFQTDEYDFIRTKDWHYESEERAEYLENFLFICPECKEIASMRSHRNTFTCTCCGFSLELDSQYRFKAKGGIYPGIDTPAAWNEWQRTELKELLDNYIREDSHKPFMTDSEMKIQTGYKQDAPRVWTEKGEIGLFKDHIMLRSETGEVRLLPLEELSGIHVMTRQKLEFYHHKTLYMFAFRDIRLSGYKWLCALRTLGLPSSYAWASEDVEKI